MAFTTHGHHIPGTPLNQYRPHQIARCGGPGICETCSGDIRYYNQRSKEAIQQKSTGIPSGALEAVQVSMLSINLIYRTLREIPWYKDWLPQYQHLSNHYFIVGPYQGSAHFISPEDFDEHYEFLIPPLSDHFNLIKRK